MALGGARNLIQAVKKIPITKNSILTQMMILLWTLHTHNSDGVSSESELDNGENEMTLSKCESDSDDSERLVVQGRGGRGRPRGQGMVGRS